MTLGAMLGSCLIASAQDAPKRPDRPQRQIPPEMLKQFDKDGDGKLSAEERTAMMEAGKARREAMQKEMLAKYDANKDGKLDDTELAAARAGQQAENLKKYDTDGDGKLSEEERARMPRFQRGMGPGGEGRRPGGPGGEGAPPPPPAAPAAPEAPKTE